ncbi:hypothetical protein F4X86_01790 [Candidatus Saccharibacteria bacterium]|nr:hypothetical protein [Candidatus Saccharibacteria bacterium]
MAQFEKPKLTSKDTYEPLGLNQDQVYQLVDEIVQDLREAENDPARPLVFYATQNARPLGREIVWKIVYFKVGGDPSRPDLIKGDLDGGDYPYALDLASGSLSIKNALDDRHINLRPLTRLATSPPDPDSQLGKSYLKHHQSMAKSVDYINQKLASFDNR